MRKLAFLCSLLLAFYVSAFAQTDTSNSKSNPTAANQSSSQMQNSDRDKSDNFSKSVKGKGCITQQDGKYLLTDKKHPEGIELTGSQDLSAHVGHKVEIKGTWAESSASSSGSTPASSSNTANPASSASSSANAAANPSGAADVPGSTNPAASKTMGSTSGNASKGGAKVISVTEVKMISDKCDQSASDSNYKK